MYLYFSFVHKPYAKLGPTRVLKMCGLGLGSDKLRPGPSTALFRHIHLIMERRSRPALAHNFLTNFTPERSPKGFYSEGWWITALGEKWSDVAGPVWVPSYAFCILRFLVPAVWEADYDNAFSKVKTRQWRHNLIISHIDHGQERSQDFREVRSKFELFASHFSGLLERNN